MCEANFIPYEGPEKYIFVSYSHKDKDHKIVIPIINMLTAKGFRIWFDKGVHTGNDHQDEIAEHVYGCEVLIAFISRQSIKSEYCRDEISYAKKYRKRIISIFIERNVKLPRGMEMNLQRIHSINLLRL